MNNIARERSRSLKFVQVLFAILALFSLIAAVIVSMRGVDFGLPESSVLTISTAFLVVGIADTALVFYWERLFQRMHA